MQSFSSSRRPRMGGGPRHSGGPRFGGRPSRGGSSGRFGRSAPRRDKGVDASFIHRMAQKTANAVQTPAPTVEIKNKFADFNIQPQLKEAIAARGYLIPTPIQDQTIPLIVNGGDIVGVANTGTGKSAAFLLPLLNKALINRQNRSLIIVPTRELAIQLDEELRSFSKGMNIYSVICVGGASMHMQISNLRRSHNFVIGTPGRLKDLVMRGQLNLQNYTSVVLDEVDRMLDMGFIRDMQFLIGKLPQQRQSLFFSATITPQVEQVMKQFVAEYVKIEVRTGQTAANVMQEVIEYDTVAEKFDKLKEILSTPHLSKAIVFVRTKHGADKLARLLFAQGFNIEAIHSDKRQSQRTRVMKDFKAGRYKALIATDVAARGIDVADLSHVINFDVPMTEDDYVHRIGRVGRADKKGTAVTFVEKRF